MIELFAESIADAAATLPELVRQKARLVFTAHSIPLRAANRCGPDLYARQVAYCAGLVAAAAGYDDYDQVWQSRSGPPQVPWLEPDVGDHLSALAAAGTEAVIVCPVGFVSDHIEVIWDLDNELRDQADELGIALARALTPMRNAGSPVWCSISSTKPAMAASPAEWLAPNQFRVTAPASTGSSARQSVRRPPLRRLVLPGRLQDRADRRDPRRTNDSPPTAGAPRWRSEPPRNSACRSASDPNSP